MIIISICLIVLPLTKGPGWSLAAFGLVLCGVPVYLVFVMEKPWNIRPAFLNEFSGKLGVIYNVSTLQWFLFSSPCYETW